MSDLSFSPEPVVVAPLGASGGSHGLAKDADADSARAALGSASPYQRAMKRSVDIVVGSALALLAVPVIFVLAVAMAASLRSWPFFTQLRVGYRGRLFRIVKVRTLPAATPAYVLKHRLPAGLPRLVGALRRLHLDELPQLWLVPLGTLSLVGPRPRLPDEFEPMEPGFAHARVQARQGCSGLWQIGLGADGLIGESPEYDLAYLRHRSLRLDMWVLWRTFRLMVGLGGRTSLAGIPTWALARRGVAAGPEVATRGAS